MTYTDAQLLDLAPVPGRIDRVRFDLVDQALNLLGSFDVRDDSPPTVTNSSTARIFRTLSGLRVDPATEQQIDPSSDRVRPTIVLNNGAEYPWGVFLYASATRNLRSYGADLTGDLVDQLAVLDLSGGTGVSFPAGEVITDAVDTLAQAAGIVERQIEASAATLAEPIAWPIQTTRLTAMRELTDQAGMLPPYFDNVGRLIVRSAPDPVLVSPSLVYDVGGVGFGRIIDGTVNESTDFFAPNRFVTINNSPTGVEVIGTYEIDPTAPNSVPNRGFAIPEVVDLQGMATAADAESAARSRAAETASSAVRLSFGSTLDPRHDTFDALLVFGDVYLEVGWRCTLGPGGPMDHDVRRVQFDA